MKLPKFLLAENPIADRSDGRLFIIHNQEPVLLAEVHHFENISEDAMIKFQQQFSGGGRLDYDDETIFFTPVWIQSGWEPIPEASADYAQLTADKLAGVFRRMADWYKAYLIWEDKQDGYEKT